MKKILLIMVAVCSASIVAGEIDEYHDKYRKKFADAISKADSKLEDAKKERDAEVKKTIESYITILEKVKDGYTKAAELEKAIKVRDEIESMKKLLKSGESPAKTSEPKKTVDTEDGDEKDEDVEATINYELKFHPFGAKKFNGHYYKFYDETITYSEAVEEAKKHGGYLAVITSTEEAEFIASLAKLDTQFKIWLGGTMRAGRNITWVTGETDSPSEKDILRNSGGKVARSITLIKDPGTLKLMLDGATSKSHKGRRPKARKATYVVEWEK